MRVLQAAALILLLTGLSAVAIEGIPMTYLIDADGVIVSRGLRGERLLDAVADTLVEGDEEGSGG